MSRTSFRWASLASAGFLVFLCGCGQSPPALPPRVEGTTSLKPTERISLKVLKYKDLGAEVRALKGKVLVIDVWAKY